MAHALSRPALTMTVTITCCASLKPQPQQFRDPGKKRDMFGASGASEAIGAPVSFIERTRSHAHV